MSNPQNIVKHIGHYSYNTKDLLGKGYSSSVYKGRSSEIQEQLAVKVIVLASVKGDIPRTLLANELKALKMISHQNIIKTHDICQTANNMYIVSEFCNQGDLLSIIKKRLSQQQVISIFIMIVEALVYANQRGIIHRDIKPANILMKDGVAKICDFGFCTFLRPGMDTNSGFIKENFSVGSPLYMSPQAYRNNQYSTKSDMWAAGITLYEMLIGEQPFKGLSYDQLINVVASVPHMVHAQQHVKNLLSRMLCVDPQARITPQQLLWELKSRQANFLHCIAPSIAPDYQNLLLKPPSQNNLRSTHSRLPSTQVICSNTIIRGNSLTNTQNQNIFSRPNITNRPPSSLKQERTTSIQKTLENCIPSNTTRTILGETSIKNMGSTNTTKSPPKLKRTGSSKTLSINQLNIMHKHLIAPSGNLNSKPVSTTTGLLRKTSAGFVKPPRAHVVKTWIDICKLLKKLLDLLESVQNNFGSTISLNSDNLQLSIQTVYCVIYRQLAGAMVELGKLSKSSHIGSPNHSTSTNQSSDVDEAQMELESCQGTLEVHRKLYNELEKYHEVQNSLFSYNQYCFDEASITKMQLLVSKAIRNLEGRLSQEVFLNAYVFLLKYYEMLDVSKGRKSEDMVSVAGLDTLLGTETRLAPATIQSARTLAAILIR